MEGFSRLFFQASPQGSELLVHTVQDIIKANISASASMVDLYSGVGIFAGTIGSDVKLQQ